MGRDRAPRYAKPGNDLGRISGPSVDRFLRSDYGLAG
jgi:hypothetical protein